MSSQEEEDHDQDQKQVEDQDFDGSNSTASNCTNNINNNNNNNNGSFTSTNTHLLHVLQQQQQPSTAKKKRNLPGNPDPNSEVITLSPKTLVATNRFVCEICSKGFQRDQNLQLHRRGHNLPWKLKQRLAGEEAPKRRVYVCPEPSCIHHHPSRALGDLTGIKKHFSRKHGEKKWKCDKCPKKYAVQSDWKAHSKICGTKEYKCDCGTIFSRRDSFITHRAFCDALAEENKKTFNPTGSSSSSTINNNNMMINNKDITISEMYTMDKINPLADDHQYQHHISKNLFGSNPRMVISPNSSSSSIVASSSISTSTHMSATALLQKAAQIGVAAASRDNIVILSHNSLMPINGLSVTTMAGSSFAPPYDQIHSQTANYAPSHLPNSELTNNESLILSHMMQKGSMQTSSQVFDTLGSNDMMMNQMENDLFNEEEGLLMYSQSQSFLKNLENNNGIHDNNIASTSLSSTHIGDMTTVDFMGVGGMRTRNLRDKQLQQRGMDHFNDVINDEKQGYN